MSKIYFNIEDDILIKETPLYPNEFLKELYLHSKKNTQPNGKY